MKQCVHEDLNASAGSWQPYCLLQLTPAGHSRLSSSLTLRGSLARTHTLARIPPPVINEENSSAALQRPINGLQGVRVARMRRSAAHYYSPPARSWIDVKQLKIGLCIPTLFCPIWSPEVGRREWKWGRPGRTGPGSVRGGRCRRCRIPLNRITDNGALSRVALLRHRG